MIEAIKEIGEYTLKDNLTKENFLCGICKKLPEVIYKNKKSEKEEVKQYVIFLNFNLQTEKIEISFEKVNAGDKDSAVKYLWVGNNPGAKEQIFLTTDNPVYLLTKTLYNVKKRTSGDFNRDIKQILDNFFKENIIDVSKFNFLDEKTRNIEERINKIKESVVTFDTKKDVNDKLKELKSICKELDEKYDIISEGNVEEIKNKVVSICNELKSLDIKRKLIENYKKDILKRAKSGGNKREILLINDFFSIKSFSNFNVSIYTLKLNGKTLVDNQEYKDMVYYEKISCLFDRSNKNYKKNFISNCICSICGEEKETTSNTTNLDFKFYMTDKIGFSSNLDRRFTRNYNICKECYQYLLIGENFIDGNLKTAIGGLNTYVIPHFILKTDKLDIKEFSKYINSSSNSIVNLEGIKRFKEELEKFRKYETNKNNFIINYMFYHQPPGSSKFKILKFIKDVPLNRLDFIRRKEEDISNLVDSNYGGNRNLKIDLNQIWGCIPIKKGDKGSYSGVSRYLEIIDAIFSDKRIDYKFLINQFTEVIRITKFDREGYNIWIKQDFTNKILQLNFLLLFLNKLGVLEGINMGEIKNKNIEEIENFLPEEILNYWEDIKVYSGDECKKALFLLGYLIGEIGNAQSSKEIKKKPILNKINFQGMGTEKLIRLTNDILEKLRQYKGHDGKTLLEYDEDIYSVLKLLIDNNIEKWNLSDQENVFYILSGYAFSNHLLRKRSKNKYFEELKKISEYIKKVKEKGNATEEMEKILEEAKKIAENYKYSEARKILKKIEIPNKEVE